MAYREKYGPLSVQLRQERIAAAQMHHMNTIHGGKAELSVFMLFSQEEDQQPQEASIDDVLVMLQASAIKK
ncbi:hypothetical protein H5202_09480 [Shewanella sp. SG41-4]|uniref:hypothetical protein n=1 Tax=Shewanella sp. SG41-4 TaxID=2760976 RepID=UPI001601819F|nr:hypothetical protein [Shewanella sp. SG41-4]MBB1438900.1 hypothetical protein [Shewanella sp. SG41-4]